MPYIEQESRDRAEMFPRTPGELNFAITRLLTGYIAYKGQNYTYMNDALGALEGAKLEFYRRVVVPYENAKREHNGDVYPSNLTSGA